MFKDDRMVFLLVVMVACYLLISVTTTVTENISTSGDVSGAQTGFAQGTAAASTSQSVQTEDQAKTTASARTGEDDEKKRKPRETPMLARTVGRVTVILPTKN